ncbi:MAG: nucleotidyltransferase domain-containing protein [Deltaproteobacteria bacterium]|nr:nucleotidyltransferase domain-containing protein [Deltaproteobacteria bacterium]
MGQASSLSTQARLRRKLSRAMPVAVKEVDMLTNDERKALESLKNMISRKYKLIDFILYGSKASGRDTEESDIDVMVELEEESRDARWDIYSMAAEVNMGFGCVISPILFSRRELEEGPMDESPIYRRIAAEGVRI